jgi:dephospho-CoA kinase
LGLSVAAPVRRIGLTGGIGSGKSTVATTLVERGAWLVDTDAIARALTAPGGAGIPALAQAFGPEVVSSDGSLDRQRMRALAFADPGAKVRLEAVLHPMIGVEAARQAALAAGRAVVFDVPLLAESKHWRARVDRVLVVDCNEATQRARVMARSGWTEAMVQSAIEHQATRSVRRAIADAVIHNEGLALDDLAQQVRDLWRLWVGPVEQ